MDIAPTLRLSLGLALATDAIENAAGFGRWWLDGRTAQMLVSGVAARFPDDDVGWHASLEACFAQVVPEDMLMSIAALARRDTPGYPIDCEFRIINEVDGLRWLRIKSVLANPSSAEMPVVHSGVLMDITASKHAAMRERFSFESTQLVIGTHSEAEAVSQVIQLVCENLGWEWGAYWSIAQGPMGEHQLACKHYWHTPDFSLKAFTQESCSLTLAPGEDLIGEVWSSACASWVEDAPNDPSFLRRKGAQGSGLQSGYAFPVSYVTPDGRRHSPGVLEFFSSLFRQREAQLPNLSASIGSLIAQTVQRLEQQEYIHHLLEAACTGATASQASFGVLYIDLDRFKPLNDAFGHDAGNVVLHAFAQRLLTLALAPKGCHVGRLGGDEFAILTAPMTGSIVQLRTLAERVLQAALTSFQFEGHTLTVSASVGISMFPVNGCTAQALLRGSDAAMYRIKQGGRNALGFLNSPSKAMDVQQSSMAQQLTMEAVIAWSQWRP
jgi:diguanylate cyclase (GGDEF)-like protein